MADVVSPLVRSRMMAGIRGKNTKPELVLRRMLHALGFRYRLHVGNLPGRPDLALRKYRVAVFVHGCFWHHHRGCRYATVPATRAGFWQAKFEANIRRDEAVRSALGEAGWRVLTVWECALRRQADIMAVGNVLKDWIPGEGQELEIGADDIDAATGGEGRGDLTIRKG